MNILKWVFTLYCFLISFVSMAQQENNEATPGYISDELIIYMHTGAGKNYRIAGTINSGSQVGLTGLTNNNYTQIIDNKGRITWVESKFVSSSPGLREKVAHLENELTERTEAANSAAQALDDANIKLTDLNSHYTQVNQEVVELKKQLLTVTGQLKTQDTDIQLQWFYKGAMVLAFGLILGLVLPIFLSKKRKTSTWT
jgi:SH3 domain protein